jgi:quercetin dioxygenase-like cupin family protein
MTFIRDNKTGEMHVEGQFWARRYAGPDLGAAEINVLHARWEVTPTLPQHFHDHEEILIALSGGAVVLANGEEVRLSPGDVWISPAGELHGTKSVDPGGAEYIAVWPIGTKWFAQDGTEMKPYFPC